MKRTNTRLRTRAPIQLRPKINVLSPFMLFTTLFIAGMLAGVLSVRNTDSIILEKLMDMFQNYAAVRRTQSMLSTLSNSVITGTVYLLAAYLFGLCTVGAPFSASLLFFKGLGLGMVSGHLYTSYAGQGVGYCALVLFPGAICAVITLILCCKESTRFSNAIFRSVCLNKKEEAEPQFRDYSMRFIIFMVFTAFNGIVDMLCTKAFAGFFTF